jgi:TorA maturation chaperone TorD
MDEKETRQLMALFSAYALAIAALFETHPQPEQLRSAFARLAAEGTPNRDEDQHTHEIFQAAIETLQRSIR